ncbi:MAG: hypothetical protein K2X11_04965 [Acetobacteraceae bacterium]|nr:hypothetical protein [Acetobacteraceae bacterium]
MTETRTIFADGLLDASVHHGVARLNLAQLGSDGKPVPSGQLCVPLTQLPALTNGLVTLLRQIEAKVKEAQAAQAAEAPPAEAASMPSAFTFGGR